MASAGGVGIDLDVARVPLREADMEPFEIMVSESQERMLARGRAGDGCPRCWRSVRSGRRARPRSASSPTAAGCGCCAARRSLGDMPVEALVDGCPLYDLRPAEPERVDLRQPGDARAAPPRPRRRCSRCSPPPASPRSAGPSSSTTRWSARAPCAGPSRPTPRSCSSPRRATRSPSRSTATAAASPATPTRERSRRCSSAPRTSPASAPSRSA